MLKYFNGLRPLNYTQTRSAVLHWNRALCRLKA